MFMRRSSYGSGKQRRGRSRYSGPDFGKLYKEKKSNRLLGFFVVLLISVGIGVGAYVLADYHLDKKEAKSEGATPTPMAEVTPEVTATPDATP